MEAIALIYGASGSDPNGTAGSDAGGSYRQYATITAPIITRGLVAGDQLSVGNCIAGTLDFTIMTTDNIPKSAKIKIKARPTDGVTFGEWLEFGTFWVDTRSKSDDLIDIAAYDAMKMGNQAYSDNSAALSWPKTIGTVVTRAAQQMGVSIDSRTASYVVNSSFGSLDIITKPSDDMTLLDILGYIGGVLGGNWTITPENKLRFVPLVTRPVESYNIVDSRYNKITTDQGVYLKWQGAADDTIPIENAAEGGTINVPVVLGEIRTAKSYTISKVTMYSDADHVYTYGDNTGFELIVADNPYATAALCSTLYTRVNGIEYAPFQLVSACYDPAAELGDWIYAGEEVRSVLFNETLTFDVGFRADVSAPGEDELEGEFPYKSIVKRMQYILNSKTADLYSAIEQTQGSITAYVDSSIEDVEESTTLALNQHSVEIAAIRTEVSRDYTRKDSVRSAFALDPTNITLTAGEDQQGNPTGTITFNTGALIVNGRNFSLDEDGKLICYGAEIHGDFSAEYTPPEVPEIDDASFKVTIDGDGLSFYSNSVRTASIHEDISAELSPTSPSGYEIVDDGLVIESVSGLPVALRSSGANVVVGYSTVSMRCSTLSINGETGYTGNFSINGTALYFINGILYQVY